MVAEATTPHTNGAPLNWTRQSSHTRTLTWRGRHRFEHCRRDNQVYFITARCRDKHPAFASDQAKHVFWDRFDHAAQRYEFFPWVVSLLDNHYHMLGYLRHGDALGPMMQRFHGSVAKLVNDLNDRRLAPFWIDGGHRNYFDGCIRDERQCRLAYRDTLTQAVRQRYD